MSSQKFSFMLCSDCKNDTYSVQIIGETLALVCTKCNWCAEIKI